MEKPIIGITSGDLNGIGLETIIKVFSDNRMLEFCTPVIFASNKVINYYRRVVGDNQFSFQTITDVEFALHNQVNVYNCWEEDVNISVGELTEVSGKCAVKSLVACTNALKDGHIQAMVTAPIHKKNTHSEEFNYTGHTPYLKDYFNAEDVVMMLYSGEFKVALVTEHLPIAQLASTITKELIVQKAQILHKSLVRDFGIAKPKIAVLGLNPHAGDHGLIGEEEIHVIAPAIEALQEDGIMAFGPYSADGFFAHAQYNKFDAVLAMYHDQGLIPFKSLCVTEGVNYTCGLPVVRTSPDHGTAFDIAGKNKANPESLREAIFEAIHILRERRYFDEMTANPLERNFIAKER